MCVCCVFTVRVGWQMCARRGGSRREVLAEALPSVLGVLSWDHVTRLDLINLAPAWPPLCPTTHNNLDLYIVLGFPGGSAVKNLPLVGDPSSIPGLGRSLGGGNGNPLQFSCLENYMDRGARQAIVHSVANRWTWLNDLTLSAPSYVVLYPWQKEEMAMWRLLMNLFWNQYWRHCYIDHAFYDLILGRKKFLKVM